MAMLSVSEEKLAYVQQNELHIHYDAYDHYHYTPELHFNSNLQANSAKYRTVQLVVFNMELLRNTRRTDDENTLHINHTNRVKWK